MKFLFALMAIAMLTVSVGCEKAETPKTPAKTPAATTPAPVTPAADPKKEGASADNSANENIQLVSLKLPGMS